MNKTNPFYIVLLCISLFSSHAYAVFDPAVNLALNKPATARDTWTGDGGAYAAYKAVDGSLTTSWMSAIDASSTGSWLYVDLQNYYLVNKVVISWNNSRWPNGEWKIQAATQEPDASGNSNWIDVYTGNAGTGVVTGIGTYDFTATAGRYVRMLGVARSNSYGYHINEMSVYASDVATPGNTATLLAITPSSKTLVVNQPAYQFQSAILSENGVPMNITYTPTWAIQDSPSGASITADGLFKATQTGTYTVTCTTTYNSTPFSASSIVTVNPFVTTQNLALNKTATTSSTVPSSGNDGNIASRWRSNNANEKEWWQVDLGADYVINNATIRMNGDPGARGATYNILVSLTGLADSWQTVVSAATIPSGSAQEFNSHTFAAVPARYVKYDGITNGGWDHNFAEFEVYGTGFYNAAAVSNFTSVLFNNTNALANEETALTIGALDQNNSPFLNATITNVEVTTGNAAGVTLVQRNSVWYATGLLAGTYTLTATAVDNANASNIKTGTATLTISEARRVATINLSTTFPNNVYAANQPIALNVSCIDQYGAAITNPTFVWDIQGTAAGAVTDSYNYTPGATGTSTVTAKFTTSAGLVQSATLNFNVVTAAPNVALSKTLTAIATATTPESAIDNNLNSFCIFPDVPESLTHTYDGWVTIDLGAKYIIEMVEILWEGAYSKSFTVDYSNDNEMFVPKYTVANNVEPVVSLTVVNKFSANPSSSRYVRIFSTVGGTQYGVKIREARVFGVLDLGTSSQQVSLNSAFIYPNPATDRVNFTGDVVKVAFYTLQGQLIHSVVNKNTVDVSSFAKGLYLVRVTDKTGNQQSSKLEIK